MRGMCMSRPKRKAAEDAVERIQKILAWEGASESSKLFKTCAAAIDAEFEREQKHKRVKLEEIDESDGCDSESCEDGDEVCTKEDIDFIEHDNYQKDDCDWVPEVPGPEHGDEHHCVEDSCCVEEGSDSESGSGSDSGCDNVEEDTSTEDTDMEVLDCENPDLPEGGPGSVQPGNL